MSQQPPASPEPTPPEIPPQSPNPSPQPQEPGKPQPLPTDTTPLQRLVDLQTESRALLQQIAKEAQPSRDLQLEEVLGDLDPEDVLLRYRIEIFTKDGLVASVKGSQNLPNSTAPYALKDAIKNFDQALFHGMFRPTVRKFTNFLNKFVTNENIYHPGSLVSDATQRAPRQDPANHLGSEEPS